MQSTFSLNLTGQAETGKVRPRMNLSGTLYLGRKYLQRHRGKAAVLIAAITLSLFLPVAVTLVVQQAETQLRARSADTPLLLGAPGSPLELVFNSVYFSKPDMTTIPANAADPVRDTDLATAIPIYARYQSRGYRIVGTSLEYFEFRDLKIAEGDGLRRLGDCVLGAEVARDLGLGPEDKITSSPEQLFDIAGVYPLRMRIRGVLEPSGGPDDRAIFVDLKTAWVIEGIAHGHEEPVSVSDSAVLETDGNNVALNASVKEYNEITPENVRSFHFHGDPGTFPISGVIVVPKDLKSGTILLGKYPDPETGEQLVRPATVMDELFNTVFRIRDVVVLALGLVGLASAVIAGLVFVLSNRLRAREFESLRNLGADQKTMRALLGFEAGFVLICSVALAGAFSLFIHLIVPRFLPLLMS